MVNLFKNKLFQILLLATFLHLFKLGSVPPSLNWDEVSQGYTSYSISQTGMDEWGEKYPLFFRSFGEWKSAVYIYLLVPFIKVLGLSAFSIRLPAAIASIISVYLIYLICRKLYSEKVALWAAFLMAVTPWSFMLGRPAFEANVALALVLGGIYLFLANKLVFSAILFGLAPHTYNSAKIVVPFIVVYLIISTKLYKHFKSTILVLGILMIFAIPILANLYSGKSLARFTQVGVTNDAGAIPRIVQLRERLPLPSVLSRVVINKYSYFGFQIAKNFVDYLAPGFLVFNGGDRPQQSLPGHGVIYLTQLILVILGLHILINQKKEGKTLPLVLILLGIIPAAITKESEHVLRSIMAGPGFVILSALGLDYLSLKKFKFQKLIYVFIALEATFFMFMYFYSYPKTYARDWQYGYAQVSQYVSSHEQDYDQIVVTKWYGEPQLFLAFYGKWDPTWYQAENLPNLQYETEGQIWLDQLKEYNVGKYTFKYIDWDLEKRDKKTLYIGKFDDFPGAKVLESIKFPDGTVAFNIVAGDR